MESGWALNSSLMKSSPFAPEQAFPHRFIGPAAIINRDSCIWGMCMSFMWLRCPAVHESLCPNWPAVFYCQRCTTVFSFLCHWLIFALRIVRRQWCCIWETLWCSCESHVCFLKAQNGVIRGPLWMPFVTSCLCNSVHSARRNLKSSLARAFN